MSNLPRSAFVAILLSLGLASGGCSQASQDTGPKPPDEPKPVGTPGKNTDTPGAQQTDLDRIQGTWRVEWVEFGGKKEHDTDKSVFVFQKSKVIIRENSEERDTDPFKLDDTKSPKTIDIGDPTKKPDDLTPGIYELNGDQLKICFAKGQGKTRPTAFESKPGADIVLVILKRDKNAPPEPEEKEPNFAEFPAAIIGKWNFSQGETAFGFFAGETEFTKDGRVLAFDSRKKTWEERFKYRFDKDELVLLIANKPADKPTERRFKIVSIADDLLVSKSPKGKLKRLK